MMKSRRGKKKKKKIEKQKTMERELKERTLRTKECGHNEVYLVLALAIGE